MADTQKVEESTATAIRRYNYGIKIDKAQEIYFANTFGCARVVYNDAIAVFTEESKVYQAWKKAKAEGLDVGPEPKPSTAFSLQKKMALAKKTEERSFLVKNVFEEPVEGLKEVKIPNVCLQQSISHAAIAHGNWMSSFSGRRKGSKVGFPRFKKKGNAESVKFTEPKIRKLNSKWIELKLPNMDTPIKVKTKRNLPSTPKSFTITRNANGNFSVSFTVEIEVKNFKLPKVSKNIGIDIGLTTLAVTADSDGKVEHIQNPRFMKNNAKKLANLQRNLARKEKGSNNRRKQAQKVAKLHQIVANNRRHNSIKIANQIIAENQVIVLESLNIAGLKKKSKNGRKRLGKSISDAGWGGLVNAILDKAKLAEREVLRADRFYASSQICSACNENTGKKPLNVRDFTCPHCKTHHDRDENAAKNLLKLAGE